MNLRHIINHITQPFVVMGDKTLIDNFECANIALDSRKVVENTIFFAVIGQQQDGANFLPIVVSQGCKVAVIARDTKFNYQDFINNNPNFLLIIGDVYPILIEFLAIFYQQIPQKLYAITGTNGKTSVAEFTRQILQFLNIKSASIGTLGVKSDIDNLALIDTGLTTPDIVSLYQNLTILKQNNIDDVAIEVSSIGLDQQRIGELKIGVGAFTNFTQDHLDYHQNMANYFASKMILFEKIVVKNGYAILNADIPEFAKIKNICAKNNLRIIDYGYKAQIFKIIKITNLDNSKLEVIFIYQDQQFSFDANINGDFQVYNIICALAIVVAQYNLSPQDIAQLLPNFSKLNSASGRMEKVGEYLGAKIFIDFAHTPDALENVLKLARNIAKNRVVILFGCGGNRDSKKRGIMGEIASNLADVVVISDDNPRHEDAQNIRQQILQKCDKTKTIEIGDRKIAIAKTIEILQDGDVLIIAGKGHENYQIIGSQKFAFNEAHIVKNVITKLSQPAL